ncbi:MAG: putative GNAT family N-acyltransferase [Kiritimatiellia bacterium]|jgi:predicted GNAT family N-acyltransferase
MGQMESIHIIGADWEKDRDRLYAIREAVFTREQGVPREVERDEHDARSFHVLAVLDGLEVGTGRLLPDGHIGRVGVLKPYRRRGVGQALMRALIQRAKDQSFSHVGLASQTHALGFYERLGFVVSGDEFVEAGIPHWSMRLDL